MLCLCLCIAPTLTLASYVISSAVHPTSRSHARPGDAPRAPASRAQGIGNCTSAACSKLSIPYYYSILSAAFSLASILSSVYPNYAQSSG
ncbi:hypothetical protein FB451DRAFT_1242904 [Mycena latifolia]|nr:hypothetical protein FB451DRAFT_1242904 [Mycena latifolia]